MPAGEQRPYRDPQRQTLVYNTEAEVAPAFCVLEISGWDEENQRFTVRKPTKSGRNRVILNGPAPIPPSAEGQASLDLFAPARWFDDGSADAAPAGGESWGPKGGEWFLCKRFPGFTVAGSVGDGDGKLVLVHPQDANLVEFVQVTGCAGSGGAPADYSPAKLILFDATADAWVEPSPAVSVWFRDIDGKPAGPKNTEGGTCRVHVNLAGYGSGRPVYAGRSNCYGLDCTTSTTTTTTPAGCPTGECHWSGAGSTWTLVSNTCTPGAASCMCPYPDFCPGHGCGGSETAITYCCNSGRPGTPPACGTTTTTTTTAGPTTTAGLCCDPGGGTEGPVTHTFCCLWMEGTTGGYTRLGPGPLSSGNPDAYCGTFCYCNPPATTAGVPCRIVATPCLYLPGGGTTTTTAGCSGNCTYKCQGATLGWVQTSANCSGGGADCACCPPTAVCGGTECGNSVTVPCNGSGSGVETTGGPGTPCTAGRCYWCWDGSRWQFTRTTCPPNCSCSAPGFTGASTGQVAFTACGTTTTTTTTPGPTTTTTTTTTTCGPPWCNTYCVYQCTKPAGCVTTGDWSVLFDNCGAIGCACTALDYAVGSTLLAGTYGQTRKVCCTGLTSTTTTTAGPCGSCRWTCTAYPPGPFFWLLQSAGCIDPVNCVCVKPPDSQCTFPQVVDTWCFGNTTTTTAGACPGNCEYICSCDPYTGNCLWKNSHISYCTGAACDCNPAALMNHGVPLTACPGPTSQVYYVPCGTTTTTTTAGATTPAGCAITACNYTCTGGVWVNSGVACGAGCTRCNGTLLSGACIGPATLSGNCS